MKQIVEGEEWINRLHGRVGKVIKVFVKNGELHVTWEVITNDGEKDHRTLDENNFRWLYKPPSTED
tara:strand:- start:1124 stop:1321 length:198 start_codon:yes stop_codon:yes gene_type:complete